MQCFASVRNWTIVLRSLGLGILALNSTLSLARAIDPNDPRGAYEQSASFSTLSSDDLSQAMRYFAEQLKNSNAKAKQETQDVFEKLQNQMPELIRLEKLSKIKTSADNLAFASKMDEMAALALQIYIREGIVPDQKSPLFDFHKRWANRSEKWKSLVGISTIKAVDAARKLLGSSFDALDNETKTKFIAQLQAYQAAVDRNGGKASDDSKQILRELTSNVDGKGQGPLVQSGEILALLGGHQDPLTRSDTQAVLLGDNKIKIDGTTGRALTNYSAGPFDGALSEAGKPKSDESNIEFFSLGKGPELVEEIASDYGALIARGDYDEATGESSGGRSPASVSGMQHDGTSPRVAVQSYSVPLISRDQGASGFQEAASPSPVAHNSNSTVSTPATNMAKQATAKSTSPSEVLPVSNAEKQLASGKTASESSVLATQKPSPDKVLSKTQIGAPTPSAVANLNAVADQNSKNTVAPNSYAAAMLGAMDLGAMPEQSVSLPPLKVGGAGSAQSTPAAKSPSTAQVQTSGEGKLEKCDNRLDYTYFEIWAGDGEKKTIKPEYANNFMNSAAMLIQPQCQKYIERLKLNAGCIDQSNIETKSDCGACLVTAMTNSIVLNLGDLNKARFKKHASLFRVVVDEISENYSPEDKESKRMAANHLVSFIEHNSSIEIGKCADQPNSMYKSLIASMGATRPFENKRKKVTAFEAETETNADSNSNGSATLVSPHAGSSMASSASYVPSVVPAPTGEKSASTAHVASLGTASTRGEPANSELPSLSFSQSNSTQSCEENFNQNIKKQLNGTSASQNFSRYFNRLYVDTFRESRSEISRTWSDPARQAKLDPQKPSTHVVLDFNKDSGLKNLCTADGVCRAPTATVGVERPDEASIARSASAVSGRMLLASVLFAKQPMCVGENGKFPFPPTKIRGGALAADECPALNIEKPTADDQMRLAALNWWVDLQQNAPVSGPKFQGARLNAYESFAQYTYSYQTLFSQHHRAETGDSGAEPYVAGVGRILHRCDNWRKLAVETETRLRADAALCGSIEARHLADKGAAGVPDLLKNLNLVPNIAQLGIDPIVPEIDKRLYDKPSTMPDGIPKVLLESSEESKAGLSCNVLRKRYAFWLGLIVGSTAKQGNQTKLFETWIERLDAKQAETLRGPAHEASAGKASAPK